jgi:hypothetical protein
MPSPNVKLTFFGVLGLLLLLRVASSAADEAERHLAMVGVAVCGVVCVGVAMLGGWLGYLRGRWMGLNARLLARARRIFGRAMERGWVVGVGMGMDARVREALRETNPKQGLYSRYAMLNLLRREIAEATRSIDVCVYLFTWDVIAQDLVSAKKRGVKVRVMVCASVFDGGKNVIRSKSAAVFKILEGAGIHCKAVTLPDGNLFHEKFLVFDGVRAIKGSANLTAKAFFSNVESVCWFKGGGIPVDLGLWFNSLWRCH